MLRFECMILTLIIVCTASIASATDRKRSSQGKGPSEDATKTCIINYLQAKGAKDHDINYSFQGCNLVLEHYYQDHGAHEVYTYPVGALSFSSSSEDSGYPTYINVNCSDGSKCIKDATLNRDHAVIWRKDYCFEMSSPAYREKIIKALNHLNGLCSKKEGLVDCLVN